MSVRNLIYRLLRRGEKYTGTDNVYLAKNGSIFAIAQFLLTGFGLLVAILASRVVEKDAYGTYSYLTTWGAILSVASLSGMSSALSSAVARGYGRTLYTTMRARFKWGLLGTAFAVALGSYYLTKGRADLFAGLIVVGIAYPLASTLASWVDYAVGKRRFDLQMRYCTFITIASLAALAIVMIVHPKPLFMVMALSITPIIGHFIAYRRTLAILPISGETELGVVAYGLKLSLLDAVATVTFNVDRLLLFTMLGSRETAIYAFAMAPSEQLKGLLKSTYQLALPKVAVSSLERIREGFFKKTAVFLAVTSIIIIAYIVAAPYLFRWLFPKYLESVGLSQLLAISLLGIGVILPTSVFTGHKLVRENYLSQIVTAVVNLGLMATLIPLWGLKGAVAARIIGRLFGATYALVLVRGVFSRASQEAQTNRSQSSGESASA